MINKDDTIDSWLVKDSFSYPGWVGDYEVAQREYESMTQSRQYVGGKTGPSMEFRKSVHKMNEKQRVFEGDRSHPRLVALDRLSDTLSYPGWEEDVKNYEEAHFQRFSSTDGGDVEDVYFQSKLEGIQNRQHLYFGTKSRDENGTTKAASSAQEKITGLLGPCIICGERDKTHLFDPCGHLCACQSCAETVMRRSLSISPSVESSPCPVCRVPSRKVIRVYFS